MKWLMKIWINILESIEKYISKAAAKSEPERVSLTKGNQGLSIYPLATYIKPEYISRGLYQKKYPEGAVVHFTAGRSKNGDNDALNTVNYLRSQGLAAFVISSTGNVYQAQELTKWGYHAGVAEYPGLGKSLSSRLVGIEICCAGKLEKIDNGIYKSWYGEKFIEGEVRYSPNNENIKEGFYQKYTPQQENSLIQLLLWLKSNNEEVFNFDYVLGHDEIAPTRKNDPGASLSMPMNNLRELLKAKYQKQETEEGR